MEQLSLPLTETFLVGCRVGKEIQNYEVAAVDFQRQEVL
jgi:hypothetical protein